ncbi:hypothetical protein [Desertivirga arenae]|uniref:hypothetical protein n=1 Tax=Desertivirga arenae TaxID=2810309 RepID=UPI001A97C6CD|nr:hypothetical protein [Pedobacter sp. SYSU D00823]
MKLKLTTGALWLLLLTFICFQEANAQDKKPFVVEPAQLKAGEKVLVKYDPAETVLKGKNKIKGVLYLFRDFKWIADDLKMEKKGEFWEASYLLPEDAALMTCKFSSGDLTDHGGKATYTWFIGKKDPSKGPVPGSYIGWALLRNKVIREGKPSFLSPESFIGNDVVVWWFNQELQYSPVSRRPMFPLVMEFLQATDTLRAQKAAIREADALLSQPDLKEEELLNVVKVYREVLKRNSSADSLEQVILQRFLKGQLACDKEIEAIDRETNTQSRLKMWENCKTRFPAGQLKYGRSSVMKNIYPGLLKKIMMSRLAKGAAVADLKSDVEVAPYYILTDLQTMLVEEGKARGKKVSSKMLPLVQQINTEVEKASEDRMIPESRLFSPSEWKAGILKKEPAVYQMAVSPQDQNIK